MVWKIALLAAAVVFTWYLTRPRRKDKTRRLMPCKKCGVYREQNTPCECEQKNK